jgi:hypothetical protein
MGTNLTDALISARQTSAIVRTGIVTDWDPTFVQVNVGGSEIIAAFLDWYQPPVPGDLVAVIQQDSSWLCLGRYAGAGLNLVLNPSFEDSAPTATASPGTIPVNWFSFGTITGAGPNPASVNVNTDADAPQSGQVVNINPNSPGAILDVVLTSNAIPVIANEQYFLSAYAANANFTTSSFTTPPTDVQLMACWFSTDLETFPSATLTDDYTMVQRVQNLREKPPYTFLSGAVAVPSAMPAGGVMRVGLRCEFPTNAASSIRFDFVTARKSTSV